MLSFDPIWQALLPAGIYLAIDVRALLAIRFVALRRVPDGRNRRPLPLPP